MSYITAIRTLAQFTTNEFGGLTNFKKLVKVFLVKRNNVKGLVKNRPTRRLLNFILMENNENTKEEMITLYGKTIKEFGITLGYEGNVLYHYYPEKIKLPIGKEINKTITKKENVTMDINVEVKEGFYLKPISANRKFYPNVCTKIAADNGISVVADWKSIYVSNGVDASKLAKILSPITKMLISISPAS